MTEEATARAAELRAQIADHRARNSGSRVVQSARAAPPRAPSPPPSCTRPGAKALAQQRDARRGEGTALLVLQLSLEAVVEAAGGEDELLEGLGRRLRPRQHRKERQPAVVLRVHRVLIEGAGRRETRRAQHRALLLVRLVEDREATEHEAFRRERLAERAAREALGLGRDQPQRDDAPPLIRRPLDPWYGRRRQSWRAPDRPAPHGAPRAGDRGLALVLRGGCVHLGGALARVRPPRRPLRGSRCAR